MQYYPEQYGARGDGAANDAPAIQAAIDACHGSGGGRVVLQGGKTYYSGSLILKSNVELHLEQGAVLKAHGDISAYFRPNSAEDGSVSVSGAAAVDRPVTQKPAYAFLYARDADCFSVTGQGAIDGNVWAFVKRVSPYYCNGDFYPRPTMVYAEHCNHITFSGVTMRNAPFWTLHPAGCDDVLIQGVRILNPLDCANSDGIDPDHSSNVRIIGCHVSCADDAICLKCTAGNMEYGPCRNILISGCTLTSTSAALKIGTEGTGDFENIVVDHCIISGSNRGISIQVRDGGNVKNVSFSNIIIETRRFADCWWGTAEPIVMTTHSRHEGVPSGKISNIRFFNISCDSENGVFLSGSAGNHIEDVLFQRVQLTLRAKSKWPRGRYDLRPGFGQGIEAHRSPGFLFRRADGVVLQGCRVRFSGEALDDFAQALRARECADIRLEDFDGQAAHAGMPAVDVG